MCKREDDSLLLTSMLGQIQVQGERLRQVEVVTGDIRAAVCDDNASVTGRKKVESRQADGPIVSEQNISIEGNQLKTTQMQNLQEGSKDDSSVTLPFNAEIIEAVKANSEDLKNQGFLVNSVIINNCSFLWDKH